MKNKARCFELRCWTYSSKPMALCLRQYWCLVPTWVFPSSYSTSRILRLLVVIMESMFILEVYVHFFPLLIIPYTVLCFNILIGVRQIASYLGLTWILYMFEFYLSILYSCFTLFLRKTSRKGQYYEQTSYQKGDLEGRSHLTYNRSRERCSPHFC